LFKGIEANEHLFCYFSQKYSWMDKDIIENWFHKKFMSEVHCFMKEKLFPQKAALLLNSVPFYSEHWLQVVIL
jgi:hypothetical protein